MQSVAVTVLGRDRPGIIAEVTGVVEALGGNLEDSSMTLLRGHFAWMLIAEVTAPLADLAAALSHLEADGLTVSIMAVHDDPAVAAGSAHLLTVHGADRPGIVATVTAIVAQHEGNITDLSTRLGGKGMYVLIAEVDLPQSADVTGIREQLAEAARDLGVGVSLRPAESDVL